VIFQMSPKFPRFPINPRLIPRNNPSRKQGVRSLKRFAVRWACLRRRKTARGKSLSGLRLLLPKIRFSLSLPNRRCSRARLKWIRPPLINTMSRKCTSCLILAKSRLSLTNNTRISYFRRKKLISQKLFWGPDPRKPRNSFRKLRDQQGIAARLRFRPLTFAHKISFPQKLWNKTQTSLRKAWSPL